MPRNNFNTKHGRRAKAHPKTVPAPRAISPEGMARALVDRGLASETILDHPRQDTPNDRHERRNHR